MAVNGVNLSSRELNGPRVADSHNFMKKYAEERDKRLNAGDRAYIDLNTSISFNKFADDPFVHAGTPINRPVPAGGHSRALIIGAGFGGLLFAVKLIKQGFKAEDICIVDPAGGFGGTWYWNRYPGVMCDTESYIYLPLLEDMDYMPKNKYSFGYEIRQYAEMMAKKYNLFDRAFFQTAAKHLSWDPTKNQWDIQLTLMPKGGERSEITVHSDYVVINAGVLSNPHLPDVPGLDSFQGHMFHSARWDYEYTGGTQAKPELTHLEGKRVGFVGTGASAIQACPELAKYAKELIVFQRTPSAVDRRDNRPTNHQEWKTTIASRAGWQLDRTKNFHAFICNHETKPDVDMVDDGWTKAPAYSALIGGPKTVTMENIAEFIGGLHALDYPRQERVRQRTQETVQDPAVAEKLLAWYPTWCKRPCFHDDYLPTFNRSNVKLVDTAGRGLEKLTSRGIVVGGQEYPVDVIIWGTGFRSPVLGSPAEKCDMTVTGIDGLTMAQKHANEGLTTLHGIVSRGFPNMFWPGPSQVGVSANHMCVLDNMSTHTAFIIAEANKSVAAGKHAVIQPTAEAEEAWAMRTLQSAAAFASMAGCTPGYMNQEGRTNHVQDPKQQQMKKARLAPWGRGMNDFIRFMEEWRAKGDLTEYDISEA